MAKSSSAKTHNHHDHDHHDHDHTHAQDPALQSPLIGPNSKVTVTIPWATVQPVYQKNLQKLSSKLQASGFRKGKVPAHMAEQMIEPMNLIEPVLQEVLPSAYSDVLQKEKKRPISSPEFDPRHVGKNVDWEIDIYFAEMPELQLGKYKDVVKKVKPAALKEIEEALKSRQEATKNLEKTEGQKPEPLTELPQAEQEEIRLKHIYRELATTIKPLVPELLVRQEANRQLEQLQKQLDQMKISVQRYLEIRKMTGEQLQQEYAGIAVSQMQLEFILAELAKTEKVEVSDQEVDTKLDELSKEPLTTEQKQSHPYRSYLFSTLLKEKVNKFLLSL